MSKSKTQTSRRQAGSNHPVNSRHKTRRGLEAGARPLHGHVQRTDATKPISPLPRSEILPVRPDLLDAVWPHVEPHLQRAVDESEGLIDIHDVREASGTGENVGMGCFRHEFWYYPSVRTPRGLSPTRSAALSPSISSVVRS